MVGPARGITGQGRSRPLENDFQIYLVDLPGCGDSADPPKPYDAESLVEIISIGVDSILPNDEAFDLISFSFGGVLSGLLAVSYTHLTLPTKA